jgi:hypothetical protein
MTDAETDLRNAIARQGGSEEYAARRAKEICDYWAGVRGEVAKNWDQMMADWGQRIKKRERADDLRQIELLAAKHGYRVTLEPLAKQWNGE